MLSYPTRMIFQIPICVCDHIFIENEQDKYRQSIFAYNLIQLVLIGNL